MRKRLSAAAAIVLAVVLIWAVITVNGLSRLREGVAASWAQVENAIDQKASLIPKLEQLAETSGSAQTSSGMYWRH